MLKKTSLAWWHNTVSDITLQKETVVVFVSISYPRNKL